MTTYTIDLALSPTVVDLNTARKILYSAGLKAFRKNSNDLVVIDPAGGVKKETLFAKLTKTSNVLGTLKVDEGFWTDFARDKDGVFQYDSLKPWEEVVYWHSLLNILLKKFDPAIKLEPSPYLGHGISMRFQREQIVKLLAFQSIEDLHFICSTDEWKNAPQD